MSIYGGTVSASAAAAPPSGTGVERWSARRSPALDNLKVLVVAAVIWMHGLIGYVAMAGMTWWPYAAVRETELSPVATLALFVVAGPIALFMMPLMFCVSGLVAGPSMRRKGAAAFARERLWRLGLPYAAYVLVLWPVLLYLLYRPLRHGPDTLAGSVAATFPSSGPLWFVGLLMLVSLGYAAWSAGRKPSADAPEPIRVRELALLAAGIAVTTFAIRLVLPFGDATPLALSEAQWPECVGLFAVGVAGSRRGWLQAVPEDLRRRSGNLTVAAAGGAVMLAALVAGRGMEVDGFLGGWSWQSAALACVEAVLAVFATIWLLGTAQRVLDHRFRLGPGLARSTFLAYLLQAFVLVGLALLLRMMPWSGDVKGILVAVGGVAGSYALAWLSISRIPLVARLF